MNRKVALALLAFDLTCLMMVAGFLFGSWVTKSPPRYDLPKMISPINMPELFKPVIRLHDKKTHKFFCSATVIAANYAVTAGHCLEGRSRHVPTIEVRDIEGQDVKGEAVAVFYEERSDQGLIMGDFKKFNALGFNVVPEQILPAFQDSERLMVVCGFPYGGGLHCFPFMNRHQWVFQVAGSGFLYPGMSGGPVIDVATMTVMGVNTAAFENGVIISPLVELLANAGIQE